VESLYSCGRTVVAQVRVLRIRRAGGGHTGRRTLARASAPRPVPQNPLCVKPAIITEPRLWSGQRPGWTTRQPDRAWSRKVRGAPGGPCARGRRRPSRSTHRPNTDRVSTEMWFGLEEIPTSSLLLRNLLCEMSRTCLSGHMSEWTHV
jgi:hypothetical protein